MGDLRSAKHSGGRNEAEPEGRSQSLWLVVWKTLSVGILLTTIVLTLWGLTELSIWISGIAGNSQGIQLLVGTTVFSIGLFVAIISIAASYILAEKPLRVLFFELIGANLTGRLETLVESDNYLQWWGTSPKNYSDMNISSIGRGRAEHVTGELGALVVSPVAEYTHILDVSEEFNNSDCKVRLYTGKYEEKIVAAEIIDRLKQSAADDDKNISEDELAEIIYRVIKHLDEGSIEVCFLPGRPKLHFAFVGDGIYIQQRHAGENKNHWWVKDSVILEWFHEMLLWFYKVRVEAVNRLSSRLDRKPVCATENDDVKLLLDAVRIISERTDLPDNQMFQRQIGYALLDADLTELLQPSGIDQRFEVANRIEERAEVFELNK